jgi:hypothetical protein
VLRSVLLVAVLVVSLPAVATAGATAPARSVDATGAVAAGDADSVDAEATAATPATTETANAAAANATASADETIVRTVTLSLTPDEPGSVRAVVEYQMPSSVTRVAVSVGEQSTVTAANGFERADDGTYEWTESTDAPTLELRVDANQTSGGRRGPVDGDALHAGRDRSMDGTGREDGFVFVDAGSWALVQVPRVGTRWRWTGADDVGIERETVVNGEGATGGEMAYLGPVQRYEAAGRGETITLVVPERATLNATPERALGSLVAGSERLRVGARSERVFVVAAPDDVDWQVAGLQYGEDDAWVLADSPVDDADSVWLHEYVHTRQSFTASGSGRWFVEGSANYYAALLAYEQGNVSYASFRENLARGQRDRYDDDLLAFPQTWSGGANYLKGALATGAVDLALRRETNRTASFQSVFRDLNAHDGTVTGSVLLDAVEDAGGPDVRQYAGGLTQSDRTADTWSQGTHERYFSAMQALFDVSIQPGGVTATGENGDRTLDRTSPTVVAGERLLVAVDVENVGGRTGAYATELRVEETVVAERRGELDPGVQTTVTFEEQFDEPGTYRVRAGTETLLVEVVEPPSPTVENVEVPATVGSAEKVTLSFDVRNDAPVPGRVVVPVSLDGEVLSNETILVPAVSSVRRTYTVSFAGAGEREVRVGDTTVTVQVIGETTESPTTDATTTTGATTTEDALPVPGFDAASALAALLAVVGLAATRRYP